VHSLSIIAIAFLVSGATLAWLSGVLYVPRLRRYLGPADPNLEARAYLKAREAAKMQGQYPTFLRRYEWLSAVTFCFLAAGLALVLLCDLIGVRLGAAGSFPGRFPNWAIAYVLLVLGPKVRSLCSRAEAARPVWRNGLYTAALMGRVTVFVSCWVPEILMSPKAIGPVLFACSWTMFGSRVWSSLRAPTDQRIARLPDHRRRALRWIALSSTWAMNFPLFWFGLKAALRGL
jgi:hypothetical protein